MRFCRFDDDRYGVVNGDKVPMVPGFGQQPRFIVTIQPTGAVFSSNTNWPPARSKR